ncbi:Molybdenum transport system permease protein ModB [Alphaproteobacteria bacterium SO-S41]|nr:Molybdenum transport system permease protein ModB [Alphaproteobacteria bacterium SO-S41]
MIEALDVFSAAEWEAIRLSLIVAFWCTFTVIPPAIAVAWLLARADFPGKILVDALVHLPLVMPPVVTGYLLLILLGRRGPVGGWLEDWFGIVFAFKWTGAVIASAVMAFPLAVRAVRVAIETVDPAMERAARSLGAGRLRTFMSVTLPLAMPGVIAGAVLAFAKSLGEFGATITFVSNIPGETQTIPSAIYSAIQTPGGEEPALRLTLMAVALSVLALIVSEWFVRRLPKPRRGRLD